MQDSANSDIKERPAKRGTSEPVAGFPLIGFSTNVYDNPADVPGSVRELASSFKAIELEIAEEAEEVIFTASPAEYDRIVAGVAEAVADQDLRLSMHAAWYGQQYDLLASDPDQRRIAVANLERSIRFCSDVGAELLTYHPGYRNHLANDILADNLRRSLDLAVPIARRAGVTLCLENMGDNRPAFAVFTPEEHAALCRDTGTFLTIDVIHLASLVPQGAGFDATLDLLVPHTRNLHIADMRGMKHQHLPIGEGDLPLTSILGKFAARGYRGAAIVEEFIRQYSTEYYRQQAEAYRSAVN